MNRYIIKNNTKGNILINDLPEIPVLGHGESHNLLGCTSLERIEGSEQLKFCIEKGYVSILKEIEEENKEEIPINPFIDDDLVSKVEVLEKNIFNMEKTSSGLRESINDLQNKSEESEKILKLILDRLSPPEDNAKVNVKTQELKEEYSNLNLEISRLELDLEVKNNRLLEIERILSEN